MMRYTRNHLSMLESLSIKDLQRLYRLRSMRRLIVSNRESRAKDIYPKSNEDHDRIEKLVFQRSLLDSQRWAVEEVLKRKLNPSKIESE